MRNWKSWIWPGVTTVASFTALAVWFHLDPFESDLKDRTAAALAKDHAWAGVALDGRDLTLQGLAPSEQSRAEALEIARQTFGVRTVIDETGLLPVQSPYVLSLEKTESGLVLNGFAPDMATRARLIGLLSETLPGIALLDQLKLARGAPEEFTALVGFGSSLFSRLSTGLMELNGTDLHIKGRALNPADHEIALELLSASPPGEGRIASLDITAAPADGDYSWSAEVDDERLTLRGFVPDPPTRSALIAVATESRPDLAVVDDMRFASGAPESVDFLAASRQAIALVSPMKQGQVALRNDRIDISAEFGDTEAFRALQAMLDEDLAGGVKLGATDIGLARISPFVWTAALSSGGLLLEGVVPSETVAEELVRSARLKLGSLPITNRMKVAAGAPEGFSAAAEAVLQGLSRLEDGQATLSDTDLNLEGSAFSATASGEISDQLDAALPARFSLSDTIGQVPLPSEKIDGMECQGRIDRTASENSVLFDTGEARIQYHSQGFLDRIAFLARQCPGVRLEISGHTDADGEADANLELSERRAEAVMGYMRDAGVAPGRMISVGYGEAKPVADNETEAGKAANRRIEFRIVE
ncbi:MAG: OmpA family protein [Hoeflea sp.]|uniref:OmpA family protein n=1 Tax=Hoeflea sp. TaxID=1940281 RepID=UPI0032EAE521